MVSNFKLIALSCVLLVSSITQTAENSQKSKTRKDTVAFFNGAATSMLLNAALCASAIVCNKSENGFVRGFGLGFLFTYLPFSHKMGQDVAEYVKGEALTSKEKVQQRIVDFFATTIGAILTSDMPDNPRIIFLGSSIAKLMTTLWAINERV